MSKIEWTGETWNPLIGCDKVSPGCKNCYAIKTAWIRMHNPSMAGKYAGTVEKTAGGKLNWTGQVNMHAPSLHKPLKNKKPTTYFVNSMSDLFHESVPFEFIYQVFSVMEHCPQHTFQVLTKRAARAVEYFEWVKKKARDMKGTWFADQNVWIGVSVENEATAAERIPLLARIPARVRFLSCEPLLGPVNLHLDRLVDVASNCELPTFLDDGQVEYKSQTNPEWLFRQIPLGKVINWVICGGESGPESRPMHPDWARSLRDQCQEAGVAFFFKQWGEYYTTWFNVISQEPGFKMYTSYAQFTAKIWVGKGDICVDSQGKHCKIGSDFMSAAYPVAIMSKVGKKKAGRLLDGQLHDAMPS